MNDPDKSVLSVTGFVVAFIVLALIITVVLGEKVATGFLGLVLLSIVLMNAGKVSALLGKLSRLYDDANKPKTVLTNGGNGGGGGTANLFNPL